MAGPPHFPGTGYAAGRRGDITEQFIVFSLDENRYALPISRVERIVRAFEPAPLPRGPSELAGLLNFRGRAVPLLDIRRFFGLPGRELGPADYFILVTAAAGNCAITADSAPELAAGRPEDLLPAGEIFPELGCVERVLRTGDGLIPVCDAARFPGGREEAAATPGRAPGTP
ncbi:MAG: chemotaxis protein CheW [Elusimicrobia bacterium]|nr:chemotaxis protein CheW [Elusimicrobiota bacterium]